MREKNQKNSDFELLIAEISKRERITIQQFEEAYILGWEDGFRAGASEAFDKGYAQGVDEGFKDGYQEAKASSALYAEEWVGIVSDDDGWRIVLRQCDYCRKKATKDL